MLLVIIIPIKGNVIAVTHDVKHGMRVYLFRLPFQNLVLGFLYNSMMSTLPCIVLLGVL